MIKEREWKTFLFGNGAKSTSFIAMNIAYIRYTIM